MLRFLKNREINSSANRDEVYTLLLKEDFGQAALDSYDRSKISVEDYYKVFFNQTLKQLQKEAETYLDVMPTFGNMNPPLAKVMAEFKKKVAQYFQGEEGYFTQVRSLYKQALEKATDDKSDNLNVIMREAIMRHDIATVYATSTRYKPADLLSAEEKLHLGYMLIHPACEGHIDTVRALLAAGANPNAEIQKQTPLIVATWYHQTEIFKILFEAGANPNVRDKDDQTPYDYAELAGFTDILNILDDDQKIPDVFKTCSIL